MTAAPDVSVLVVNWNAGELLVRCVASVPSAAAGLDFEVIVVDNASTDGSVDLLTPAPWLRYVARAHNAGFAAGTNEAARMATGRHLLLLNPDTECQPGSIRALAGYSDAHPAVAALGPRLIYPDGRSQRSAWRGYPGLASALVDAAYLWKLPALPGVSRMELDPAAPSGPAMVDHLLGACILVPAAWWQIVGPLDEGYFLFLEETDWCRRARAAGGCVVYWPEPVVVHHGEHSVYQVPERSTQQYYRSYTRFVRRAGAHRGRLAAVKGAIALAALARLALWAGRWFGRRRALASGMMRGYSAVLRDLHGY